MLDGGVDEDWGLDGGNGEEVGCMKYSLKGRIMESADSNSAKQRPVGSKKVGKNRIGLK